MKKEAKALLIPGTVAIAIFSLAIIGGLFTTKVSALHGMHQHWNIYAVFSIVSFVGTLIILLRIIASNSHSEETSWFILVMLGQLLYAGGEALQRTGLDPQSVIFWARVSGAGASLLGIGTLLFSIAYTRGARAKPAILTPILIWTTVILSIFYAEGSLIFNGDPSQLKAYPWGYNNAPGQAFWMALGWIIVPGISSGIILFNYRRHSENQLLRKQSLLFALAILAPMLVGLVTDGLLPLLGVASIPSLATLFELITCVLLYYGISRYQFFEINPAILAENVLTTMNEAVVVTRADFTVEYVNSEAEKLLDLSSADLSSISIHTLFSPDSWPKIHAYIQGQVSSQDDLGDVVLVNHTGKHTPVRVFISNLQEGGFRAYVFVISDISDIVESYQRLESDSIRIRHLLDESQQLQAQLKSEKENVEHVVEVRTQELRKAQDELKESDKLKTEFIMLGSHNLRTPITIMSSSVEMLKETQSEQDRHLFIESLEQGIKRLRDFVEDMVTIVSLESGTGQRREPIRVVDLLDPILTETKALATTKPALAFSTDIQSGEATILANSVWLRGAFRNLLSNAFKFTETGSVILSSRINNNRYEITIADTGIGVAAEELPKLFTKFHRGTDMYEYEYEGKGIGLYLTKLIVDQHAGTIRVESQPNKGSKFTVSLPLYQSSAQPANA